MCVEWLASGSQPECHPDTIRELATLGFRDPSIGIEPQIPVDIVDSASDACQRYSDLEFGLERMLDAEGVVDGLPCGAGDVSSDVVDVVDDDWSELV